MEGWAAPAGTVGVERAIHLAIDGGERREQGVVEEGEDRSHLVQRLRSMASDRIGKPQPGDLFREPPVDLVLLGPIELHALPCGQQIPDPPEVLDDRAALRLGGVGGKDGHDQEPLDGFRRQVHEGGERVFQRA